jgi:hypothetical protein
MVKVLRDFNYSVDGNNRFTALAGEDTDSYENKVPASAIEAPEIASKMAGEAAASGDYAGQVDDVEAVKRRVESARAGISDGKIGAPEMAQILDDHRVTPLTDQQTLDDAQAQADKAGKGAKAPKSATTGKEADGSKGDPEPSKTDAPALDPSAG